MQNIQIRPLIESDRDALANLANNKKIWDNLRDRMPFPYSLKDADDFICLTNEEQPQCKFAILTDSQFCGVVGLIPGQDIYKKSAELGYWIGEPYWGRGIATAAVALTTRFGFERMELVRIFAGVKANNIASARVLEKNDFALEAVARKAVFKNGQIMDELRYAKVIA